MDRSLKLIIAAAVVIIAGGTLANNYIYSNLEIFNGMTLEERNNKVQKFSDNSIDLAKLSQNQEDYVNQTVYVEGVPDVALSQEDRYIVYKFLNRSQNVYVEGCEDFPIVADRVLVKGKFSELEDQSFFSQERYERNLSEYASEEVKAEFGINSSSEDKKKIYGIKCRDFVELN